MEIYESNKITFCKSNGIIYAHEVPSKYLDILLVNETSHSDICTSIIYMHNQYKINIYTNIQ